MSDARYAGKSAFLKKKHHFYLHNRHLRSTQGGCYAGKNDIGKGQNTVWPAQKTLHMAFMQVKVMILFLCFCS